MTDPYYGQKTAQTDSLEAKDRRIKELEEELSYALKELEELKGVNKAASKFQPISHHPLSGGKAQIS